MDADLVAVLQPLYALAKPLSSQTGRTLDRSRGRLPEIKNVHLRTYKAPRLNGLPRFAISRRPHIKTGLALQAASYVCIPLRRHQSYASYGALQREEPLACFRARSNILGVLALSFFRQLSIRP